MFVSTQFLKSNALTEKTQWIIVCLLVIALYGFHSKLFDKIAPNYQIFLSCQYCMDQNWNIFFHFKYIIYVHSFLYSFRSGYQFLLKKSYVILRNLQCYNATILLHGASKYIPHVNGWNNSSFRAHESFMELNNGLTTYVVLLKKKWLISI